jgi:alpha-D-xyloside xylohydrolase
MSLKKDAALAPPGYGIIGQPSETGWTHEHKDGMDTYRSDRMTIKMPAPHYDAKTTKYTCDTCQYFSGSTPWVPLTVTDAGGKTLLNMTGWSMSAAVDHHRPLRCAIDGPGVFPGGRQFSLA